MSMFNHVFAYAMATIVTRKEEERGATAVEYALIVAGIAVGLLAAVTLFGNALDTFFTGLAAKVGITTA